jgi:large subunit ribosomal protein L10
MALSKDQKTAVVTEVADLLEKSKMTVVALYKGIDVKSMQFLRKSARDNDTVVKVVKNRLVIQALKNVDKFKNIDTGFLKDQLIYAFNANDEVASAQALASFAKSQSSLQFIGAINADGVFIGAEDVKALASLPTKEQLKAQLVGIFAAPLSGFANVLSGNIRGLFNVLNARSQNL